ncbi:ROK family protein [Patescibacteria group bacterium]|nr:ROK family protein [Patescibacteria group bacterium]
MIRVIDGGGNGFRRADVDGISVYDIKKTEKGEINNPEELVAFATASLPRGYEGICYVVAGEVSHGVVVRSPQIPWLNGVDLAERTGIMRTVVANDMDGAAMGMWMLEHPVYFLAMTWSSGIGLRVVKGGQILASSEAGHIPLDLSPFAPLCGCGQRGCAESILGGEAVMRRVIAEVAVRGEVIPDNLHPCAFLDQEFDKDNPWATDLYDRIALGMAIVLASYVSILRPGLIIWKGSFAKAALPRIADSIRNHLRSKLMNPVWADDLAFWFSPEPDRDSLIGGAVLFEQRKGLII